MDRSRAVSTDAMDVSGFMSLRKDIPDDWLAISNGFQRQVAFGKIAKRRKCCSAGAAEQTTEDAFLVNRYVKLDVV